FDIVGGPPFAAIPRLRREPGIRVLTPTSPVIEHLDFQLRQGGHPLLQHRNTGSRLIRQAIAYGIDREKVARQAWAAIKPNEHALDSLVFVRTQPAPTPHVTAYRYRPR